ncbi:MAG: sugar transferase [Paludibacteraceae bacterium]|nr:sugar transferase [Paludibacteraceae bacterium]
MGKKHSVQLTTKLIFDKVVSFFVVIFILPVLSICVWVWNLICHSYGPLFFVQKRTGLNNATFTIYKFRTMVNSHDADTTQASENDSRITTNGRILRITSIDEIPQFINVLKGDMSIIGPRPHMLYHTEYYSSRIPNYLDRHTMKPGLTGWAQVNNCRGETETIDKMKKRVEYDIWYIQNWSLALDMRIFYKTIVQFFK